MAIIVACGQCGTELRIPERLSGKSGRCTHCGGPIRVPEILDETNLASVPPKKASRARILIALLAALLILGAFYRFVVLDKANKVPETVEEEAIVNVFPTETQKPPPVLEATAPEETVVRIHAIIVSDDDGARPARTKNDQIARAVAFANEVFTSAGLRFEYDPRAEHTDVFNSSIINATMGMRDANWPQTKTYGNEIAALYPEQLVVFYRYGPDPLPTGHAFSWFDYNFVVMPGFEDDKHCGGDHVSALAHEIGHYFGLAHTFAQDPFESVQQAEAYFRTRNSERRAFDGDAIADTPPDPAIKSLECDDAPSISINGTNFDLPRRNIMSYYPERDTLSPQQIERVRWTLDTRRKRKMAMPTNVDGQLIIEIEDLEIARSEKCSTDVQRVARYAVGSWSGDAHLFCRAEPESMLMLRLPTDVTGPHRVRLYATRAPDSATVQIFIDGRPAGPPVDLYAPAVIPTGALDVGSITLHDGTHRIAITVTGKNSKSTHYHFGLDAIALIPDT